MDYKQLKSLSGSVDWKCVTSLKGIDEATNKLIDIVQYLIRKSSKVKKQRQNKVRKKWITVGIANSCLTNGLLYNIYKTAKNNKKI